MIPMILLKVVGAPVGIDVVRSHLRDRMRQDLGILVVAKWAPSPVKSRGPELDFLEVKQFISGHS